MNSNHTHEKPPTPPPRSPWRRRALIAAVCLLLTAVLAAALVEIGRRVAETKVAERIEGAAERRGWTVEWTRLSIHYGCALQIEGLTAKDAHDNRVDIDNIEAHCVHADVLAGERTPRSVLVSGVRGEVDIKALSASKSKKSGAETAGGGESSKIDPSRIELSVEDASLTLRGLPKRPVIKLEGGSLNGAPAKNGWHGIAEGRCVEGCGESALKIVGPIELKDGELSADMGFGTPLTVALEDERLPGPLSASFESVRAALGKDGVTVGVGSVAVKAEMGSRRATVAVERIDVALDGLGSWKTPTSIHLIAPRVVVSRDKDPEPDDEAPETRKDNAEPPLLEKAHAMLGEASGLVDKVLPVVRLLSFESGELILEERGWSMTEMRGGPEEGLYRARGTIGGMILGVRLAEEAPKAALEFEDVPIDTLMKVPKLAEAIEDWGNLRKLGGRVSGWVGAEAVSEPIPEEVQAKARKLQKRKAKYRSKRVRKALPPIPDTRLGAIIKGELKVKEGVLDVKGIAPGPIEHSQADVSVDATVWFPGPMGDELDLRQLSIRLPSRVEGHSATLHTRFNLKHLLNDDREPIANLRIWVDETDCAVAVGAIPAAMLPNILPHLAVEGTFAPELTFSVDMKKLHSIKLDVQGLPGTCQVTELGDYDPSYLAGDFKFEITEGVTREGIFVGPESGSWVPLRAMPMHLRVAGYVTEEWNFYKNKGFDLMRTTGAVRLNLEHGRYVYGGSTVTQQLVKNLFLSRNKTLSRKLEEAFIVWKMEEVLTKDRILELYLNCIEFGPNIYGIGRAAGFYFGKGVGGLSVLESAFITGIKPFPWMGPGPMGKGRTPETGYWPQRLQAVLTRMKLAGRMSDAKIAELAPFVVYFRTWKGPRGGPGQLPPGAETIELPE